MKISSKSMQRNRELPLCAQRYFPKIYTAFTTLRAQATSLTRNFRNTVLKDGFITNLYKAQKIKLPSAERELLILLFLFANVVVI